MIRSSAESVGEMWRARVKESDAPADQLRPLHCNLIAIRTRIVAARNNQRDSPKFRAVCRCSCSRFCHYRCPNKTKAHYTQNIAFAHLSFTRAEPHNSSLSLSARVRPTLAPYEPPKSVCFFMLIQKGSGQSRVSIVELVETPRRHHNC